MKSDRRTNWQRSATALALAVSALLGFVAATVIGDGKRSARAEEKRVGQFDFAAWNQLLAKYVDGAGRVDYARLRGDAADLAALEQLYVEVSQAHPETMTISERTAFYLDAYNMLVWKGVLSRSPKLKRVNESLFALFRTDFVVAGQKMDLDELEKRVIRPTLHDPRIHMALNCGSGGCPVLPRAAFEPEALEADLDRAARSFCNEPRNVSFDAASNTVYLSKIFDWYAKDFGGNAVAWINRYRAPTAQLPELAKVKFFDYDWRLNDRSLPR